MSTIACTHDWQPTQQKTGAQRFKTNICRHTWMASNTTAKGMVKFCNQWSNGPLLLRQQMMNKNCIILRRVAIVSSVQGKKWSCSTAHYSFISISFRPPQLLQNLL
ncbi:uncharacterized protein [Miscanthus floridulus]|uniref:uncharacterized protein n=1 Tax=Miscanthus floridulus TaxID=154761 RepID=UPI00345A166E